MKLNKFTKLQLERIERVEVSFPERAFALRTEKVLNFKDIQELICPQGDPQENELLSSFTFQNHPVISYLSP